MDPQPYIERVLDDEGLTGDLDEAEGQQLLEWLVGQVKEVAAGSKKAETVGPRVAALCQKARALGQVVSRAHENGLVGAAEVAALHGLPWPPPAGVGPAELLPWLCSHVSKGMASVPGPQTARAPRGRGKEGRT